MAFWKIRDLTIAYRAYRIIRRCKDFNSLKIMFLILVVTVARDDRQRTKQILESLEIVAEYQKLVLEDLGEEPEVVLKELVNMLSKDKK